MGLVYFPSVSYSAGVSRPRFQGVSASSGLYFNFAGGSLPSGVTFLRASTGTYYNSSGVISSASNDVARFDYNPATLALRGVLIEPQYTNLMLYSGDQTGTGWGGNNVTATAGSITSPDGLFNGTLLTATSSVTVYWQRSGIGATSGSTYSFSIYAKYGSQQWLLLSIWDGSVGHGYRFDIQNGAVGASQGTKASAPAIYSVGNGWYRISFLYSETATLSVNLAVSAPDGTVASGRTWYLFGSSFGVANSLSSYIATASSTVTRAADQLSFIIPASTNYLTYGFDDGSTQKAAVSPGAYTVPTNLSRAWIKTITGSAA